jgi:hypothetical protein
LDCEVFDLQHLCASYGVEANNFGGIHFKVLSSHGGRGPSFCLTSSGRRFITKQARRWLPIFLI